MTFRPLPLLVFTALAAGCGFGPRRAALADAPPERVAERFSGQGGRGPYFLAWRGFTPGSERVTRNGSRLYRQSDYTLDYGAGVLTFNAAPGLTDGIEIEYRVGAAQPNTVAAPATVNLLASGATRVNATYLLAQPGGAQSPYARVAAVGLGADTAGRNWKLSSNLLMGTSGGAMGDRSGLRVGGQYGMGALQFTGDYARAGRDLDPKGANGLQKDQQATGFGVAWKPSDRFRFSTQYHAVTDLSGKGESRAVTTEELALKPTNGATLTATHATEDRRKGDESAAVQTDTVRLEQAVTQGTAAVAEYQAVSGDKTRAETSRIGLTSKVTPAIRVETTAWETRIRSRDEAPDTRETGVGAKIGAEAGPFQLQTKLDQKRVDRASQSTAGVEVSTKNGAVKAQGEVGHSEDPGAAKDVMSARIEARPLKPITVRADYGQTADRLKASDPGAASHDPALTANQGFGLDFQPGKALTVSASAQSLTGPTGDSRVTAVSATLKPISFAEVSGALKQRSADAGGPAALDTQEARLALTLRKGWRITGGYTANPEQDGKVLPATRRSVGMETSLGALLLSGAYETDDRNGGSGAETSRFGLGIALSPRTQLSATYRTVNGFGAGFADERQYGVKFSRNLGERFSLSLEGETALHQEEGAPGTQVYKGSANLGMKF